MYEPVDEGCPRCGQGLFLFNSKVFSRALRFCGCGYTDLGTTESDRKIMKVIETPADVFPKVEALGYTLGKCKWCEYWSPSENSDNGSGMCGLDWVSKFDNDTSIGFQLITAEGLREYLNRDNRSIEEIHEEYYKWLKAVYRELVNKLEAAGINTRSNPELVAQLKGSKRKNTRGVGKHNCSIWRYKILISGQRESWEHGTRDEPSILVCLECGYIHRTRADFVNRLLGILPDEWKEVYPKISEKDKTKLKKLGITEVISDGS